MTRAYKRLSYLIERQLINQQSIQIMETFWDNRGNNVPDWYPKEGRHISIFDPDGSLLSLLEESGFKVHHKSDDPRNRLQTAIVSEPNRVE